jgi:hypothetical protein
MYEDFLVVYVEIGLSYQFPLSQFASLVCPLHSSGNVHILLQKLSQAEIGGTRAQSGLCPLPFIIPEWKYRLRAAFAFFSLARLRSTRAEPPPSPTSHPEGFSYPRQFPQDITRIPRLPTYSTAQRSPSVTLARPTTGAHPAQHTSCSQRRRQLPGYITGSTQPPILLPGVPRGVFLFIRRSLRYRRSHAPVDLQFFF